VSSAFEVALKRVAAIEVRREVSGGNRVFRRERRHGYRCTNSPGSIE
jgi:hypothetical protein